MAVKKVALACTVCGSRNYTISENNQRTERLEVKKFCKHCGKHTLHKETR
ncbi:MULTISPECIES: 50S ribosomal protein L33 [Lapidilactobacillus]|uniref:Large ribosomal subunit protein bL33 n=1 Tax=Lapidilactobacillus achengensis TaxID=2486000 RepID=A0ABW1UJH5_9LACO|nr:MULTISPECIES: 50S ribosomal protein L33 [Lapidilactobacillus]